MRRVHFAVENRIGRLFARHFLQTRIAPRGWDPEPLPPAGAAALISPVPLLIVHGDKDVYFPPEHGRQLYASAREPKEFWLLPGFGHAERAMDDKLVDRITAWVVRSVRAEAGGQVPADVQVAAEVQVAADVPAIAEVQAGQEQTATS